MSVSVMVPPSPGSPSTEVSAHVVGQAGCRLPAVEDRGGQGRTASQSSSLAEESITLATDRSGLGDLVRDLVELTKPRIVTMILITTVIAAVIAAGSWISATLLIQLAIGVGLVAGSAGAMNQAWERQLDSRMERTRRRPLAAARLRLSGGVAFSAVLGIVGTAYLAASVGWIPAALAVATWVLYVPCYTPLKTRSQWNTAVGAISGALPMMIGYTAGGGSLTDPRGWLLVGILVAWQYPHFMAIAWLVRKQYAAAGIRMTTTVDPSGHRAGRQSVIGMLALAACLVALVFLLSPGWGPITGLLVAVVLASTVPMMAAAFRFARSRDDLTARKLLRASLLQLPASLMLMTLAALYWGR